MNLSWLIRSRKQIIQSIPTRRSRVRRTRVTPKYIRPAPRRSFRARAVHIILTVPNFTIFAAVVAWGIG